jgi:hypothetical protein
LHGTQILKLLVLYIHKKRIFVDMKTFADHIIAFNQSLDFTGTVARRYKNTESFQGRHPGVTAFIGFLQEVYNDTNHGGLF